MGEGVDQIDQVLNNSVLKPYDQLIREFELERPSLYTTTLCYEVPEQTFCFDYLIISRIYTHLLSHILASDLLPWREVWEGDVGLIDGEQWDQTLEVGPLVSVSAEQKQSHLFILHWV